MRLAIFLCALLGSWLLLGGSLPALSPKTRLAQAARFLQRHRPTRPRRAKEWVASLNGKETETFLSRTRREAREVYTQTGQAQRYPRLLRLALLCAALGAGLGLVMGSPLLSLVLALGFYYLPLWLTQFSLYRYDRFLQEELETALSLITTSYTRGNDILAAVEENLPHIHPPVQAIFAAFCNNVRYVDANTTAQLQRMQDCLDSAIWRQWCDTLILCQSDHTMRSALLPIVSKFADQKAQQQENETKMLLPLRYAMFMVGLTVVVIPVLRVANADWYSNLIHTMFGQISLTATAIVALMTVNKAIRLSKPISYDV